MSTGFATTLQPLHERLAVGRAPGWLSCGLLFSLFVVPSYDFRAGADESFGMDPQLLVRLAVCFACGVYGLQYWRSAYPFTFQFPGAWAILFCLWSAMTVVAAESPTYAATACVVLVCVTLFVPAVLAQLDKRQILLTLFAATLSYVILAWSLYYLVPSIGRSAYLVGNDTEYRVGGDAQQLGFQGLWLIVATLALVNRKTFRASRATVPILIGLLTIVSAQSRTSLAATLLILGYAVFVMAPRQRVLALALTGVLLCALGIFALASGLIGFRSDQILSTASRTGTQEEIFNITGRTEFWPFVLDRIADSPVWGYGYGSSRHALFEFDGNSFSRGELHHAHNVLLNTLLTTGAVGGLLLLAMALSLVDGALRFRELFPTLVLLAIAVTGLTESMLYGPMPRIHTIVWLLALYWHQSETVRPVSSVAHDE